MKLEKFNAATMTEIMEKIQKKLGKDAVIYSQKKTDKGIEVVAGLHHVEQVAEQTTVLSKESKSAFSSLISNIEKLENPALLAELQALEKHSLLSQKMRLLGFQHEFIEQFASIYAPLASHESIQNNELLIKILLSKLTFEEIELIHIKKIAALVGPTGIGKSTTVAKLARRFAAKFGADKLGIISTDFQRIINKKQFYHFGKLLDIQVEYADSPTAVKNALHLLDEKRLVLIDTAGVNQNDNEKLAQLFERLSSELNGISSYLVLPCNLQSEILDDVVQKFKMPHTAGCIMTKMDEGRTIAPCLSVILKHQLKIAYCCDGQNIIHDIHLPNKAALIKRIFQGVKHGARDELLI